MARQLIQTATTSCDWHAALPDPQKIDATTQRTPALDKEIDLCGFCALVWDFVFPRLDEIHQMLKPDVVEMLVRSARSSKDADARVPVQLALHGNTTPAEPAPSKAGGKSPKEKNEARASAPAPARASKNGRWLANEDQVRCPLPHRAGSPATYWVKVRDRGSHAKSSHGLLGPQIAYEFPPAPTTGKQLDLPVKCFVHKVCAEAGGFGFKDEAGLRCHIIKAKAWEPHEDAAETPQSAAA
ncbi:hypothetical protein [Streptomyces sp. MMBL 11-1]|uniref:hypothetical protein n=1 Tax=Streptomyces sp. MMBL 11-1 TaxID=3026420 RepID=UPI002360A893|nr:hypothetical protein [Streptomyces sp. MMBL 11-1]